MTTHDGPDNLSYLIRRNVQKKGFSSQRPDDSGMEDDRTPTYLKSRVYKDLRRAVPAELKVLGHHSLTYFLPDWPGLAAAVRSNHLYLAAAWPRIDPFGWY